MHNQHPEQYTIHNGEQTFLNKSSSDDSGICFDGDGSETLGQSILENGEDINAQDKDGVTPLHWAVADNNKELAKLLIKHGADVDVRNRDKHTPLHYAAVHGYVEIVKYLIDNGANVNAQDEDGHIPLHFAVKYDNKELANLLIKHGADRSLIKDEDLIDRLNSMCDQPSEVVPSTFSHSKTHNATETPEKAEKVEKRKAKLKELRAQLKDEQKKNELLKQKIQDLESKNTTLEGGLGKAQKELTELRNCVTEHETKLEVLEKLNEENESLEQKIQDLESKNTTLNSELEENENKHSKTKVLLEKAQKELGSVDKILEKPYKSSNKIEKTNKNLSSFIKSGKNAPKIFNFTKKTLNQMTFFVDMLIVIPLHFSIPFWRNNYCTSLVFKTCNKGIAIVALVSYYSRVIDTFGQHLCLRNFISLTRSQSKFKWISKCIDKRMYFSCKATFAPP